MQAAHKALFLALLVAAAAVRVSGTTCSGTDLAGVPYTVEYTTTGDAESTSFVFTVCSTQCAASDAACQPLSGFSVGADAAAVSATPAGAAGGCGVDFPAAELGALATASPADGSNCEAFYLDVDTPDADLTDICGADAAGGCPVALELKGGETAASVVGGAGPVPVPTPSTPSPAPTPYGRRLYRSAGEGGARLGSLLAGAQGRRLSAYGGGRKLAAYGRRM